jgi:hypothetical protein
MVTPLQPFLAPRHPFPASLPPVPSCQQLPLPNPSRMNTCKRSSKQSTSTTFRITTFRESPGPSLLWLTRNPTKDSCPEGASRPKDLSGTSYPAPDGASRPKNLSGTSYPAPDGASRPKDLSGISYPAPKGASRLRDLSRSSHPAPDESHSSMPPLSKSFTINARVHDLPPNSLRSTLLRKTPGVGVHTVTAKIVSPEFSVSQSFISHRLL